MIIKYKELLNTKIQRILNTKNGDMLHLILTPSNFMLLI